MGIACFGVLVIGKLWIYDLALCASQFDCACQTLQALLQHAPTHRTSMTANLGELVILLHVILRHITLVIVV